MNLTEYLNGAIEQIFMDVFKAPLTNAKESRFLLSAAVRQKKAARLRMLSNQQGTPVPPFLIASIATQCNLRCKGCYARANHSCADTAKEKEISTERWGELFAEAENLGVSFILLAGGEPLMRPDVLDQALKMQNIIFPVFTNGTLLSGTMLEKFDRHRNLIPVLSLEGDRVQTDDRRGNGTYTLVQRAMEEMVCRGIFYGVSITITKENVKAATDASFIEELMHKGCRLVFFVEYVPADGIAGIEPGDAERRILAERQERLKSRYPGMLFLSFPGDEEKVGGCLAAGRGFFHINALGGAEPCPFSPYADTNLKEVSLRQALDSELFREIRESGLEAESHTGGCALFAKRTEVEKMLDILQNKSIPG